MKHLILLLSAAAFLNLNAKAQIKITGSIYNDSSKALAYASVTLKTDSINGGNPIGVLTDEKGKFEVQPVVKGNYLLTIRMIGYKTFQKHLLVNDNIDLGKMLLATDYSTLKDVVIKLSKPLISRKADRYILNVSQSVLTKGRNTFDILNYAPGVMTVGDAIAINGNSSTKVMINGRLLHLNGDQLHNYLSNLSADEVESIEIIPVPGAEYDAEGTGGIININLKKKHSGGLTGSVGVGAKTPEWPTYNTNEQLNYGINGLQLYASHTYNRYNNYSDYSDNVSYGAETYQSKSHAESDHHSNNYRLGVGYDFRDNQFLGIEFNGNNNGSHGNTTTHAVLNNPGKNQFNNINSNSGSRNKNSIYSLSLNYTWKIDSLGSAFKFTADYTSANYNQYGNYNSRYYDILNNFLFDSIYQNHVPLKINNYDAGFAYNKNWKHAGSLKLGAKYTQTHTLNEVLYQNLNDGKYFKDSTRSNVFDYTENIAAAYIQYAKDWKKTSLQLGLRGENTHTEGVSPTTNAKFTRNYFNLFPSAFVKHDFSNKHTLSLSYSRRLDRPIFSILNPFELRASDYSYVKGNPDLAPEYTHDIQLAYLFDKKYELMLFTQMTKKAFGQPLSNGGSNSIISEYLWQNMKFHNNYGINLYLPFTVTKWWTMINNFLVAKSVIDYTGEYTKGKSTETIFQAKTTQDITLKKSWRFELSAYYVSGYNKSNLLYVPNYSIDLGLHKTIKNKLDVSVLATDILNTNRMDYHSINSDIILVEKQKYLTRKFSLQLTYNFKSGKKVKIKKVQAGNSDEKDRM